VRAEEEAEPRPDAAAAGEARWTVRRVAGIEARDGRVALALEAEAEAAGGAAGPGRVRLDLALPALLELLHALTRAALERWPAPPPPSSRHDPGAADAAAAAPPGPPLLYPADAVRLRAVAGPEPALLLDLRSAYAAPLRVRLAGGMARPLLDRLRRAAAWLEQAERAAAADGRADEEA
jgi:hypothetical protein